MTRVSLLGPVYPYRGGIAHYTSNLAWALKKKATIQVISFKRQYPLWLYPGKTDQEPSQPLEPLPTEYLLDPLAPLTWWQSVKQIRKFQPDLVVLQWWTTFWAPAFGVLLRLLKKARIPALVLVHNVLPHEARWWDQPLTRWAWQARPQFLVQTSAEQRRLKIIQPQAKIYVESHPVYEMFHKHQFSPLEAQKRLNLPTGRPIILFFGLVRPYKGLTHLIEAWGILKRQGVAFHGVVAGEFWEAPEIYQKMIAEYDLGHEITIENRYIPNEEVGLFFSAASILAAPYLGGTQSGIVNIAYSFGLPVVITHAEWLPADHAYPALVVPPGNASDLAAAIQLLLAQPRYTDSHAKLPSWDDLAQTILAIAEKRSSPL